MRQGKEPLSNGERSSREELQRRLEALRQEILEVDEQLVELIGRRGQLVLEIGRVKRELDLPVLDPAREAAVIRRAAALARERNVDEEVVRDVIWRIMDAARREQRERPR